MEYVKYSGQKLKENEYLLKVHPDGTGFMTKLTQKGELPKSFVEWRDRDWMGRILGNELEIYVMEEIPRSGWKIKSWRFGQSQNWATVIHPLGFTVEVYLQDLLHTILKNTIVNGEIQGIFEWKAHKLIQK